MVTQVTKENLVAVPKPLAEALGIRPGTHLDWQATGQTDVLSVKVLPDYATLAASLVGAGRKYLKTGEDPIAALLHDRRTEDEERQSVL